MTIMSNLSTRETILVTASHLYATRGYEAVSMRDVATAVGVTPANLYYHFRDKKSSIREALAHVFSEKTAPMEALFEETASSQMRLHLFVEWFVRLIFEDPIFSRLLSRELLDGSAERLEYLAKVIFDRPFSLLTKTIADYSGQEEPALSALSVVSMILGHYQLAGVLPHFSVGRAEYGDPEVLIRHFIKILEQILRSVPSEEVPA